MDSRIKRIYVPMTESGFYILFCLRQPQHGYGISRQVRQMTDGELVISAGTMYGTLSKMEKDGLIAFEREEEKRKLYQITELGKEVLQLEIKRIERMYKNIKGEEVNGCCVFPNFIGSIESNSPLRIGFTMFLAIMILIYSYLIVYCGLKLRKLKEKYRND